MSLDKDRGKIFLQRKQLGVDLMVRKCPAPSRNSEEEEEQRGDVVREAGAGGWEIKEPDCTGPGGDRGSKSQTTQALIDQQKNSILL